MRENPVIIRPEVFREDYIPEPLLGRQKQMEELMLCLAPALKQRKPLNVCLYGKPGTGKTAVARHVLDVMHRQGVKGVYVNCWENKTLYFVADRIVREQRILFAEKTEAVLKLERFQRTLGNKPFVLVLDEIDKPVPAERDAILYHLSGIGNVGLVCICNSRSFLLSLDQRILSRLGLRAIGFEPYSQEEMRAILKERAEAGLRKGTDVYASFKKIWATGLVERLD